MSKKYLIPLLIMFSVPLFLLVIKLTSLLLIMLFNAGHESSIAYGLFLDIVAVAIAVGAYISIEDDKKNKFL